MSGLGAYVRSAGFVKQTGEQFDESYQRGYQIHVETWRGPTSMLQAFLDSEKPLTSEHPTYSAMRLADRTYQKGIGFTEVNLIYWGFRDVNDLTANGTGIITLADTTELVNTSVTTDKEGETVDFKHYAPTTTVGWIYSGENAPSAPRFAGVLASGISVQLFDPFPPDYEGTPQTEFVLRTVSFTRERIAPGLWACVEVNQVRVEPNVTKPTKVS